MRTEMDALVIGNHSFDKASQPALQENVDWRSQYALDLTRGLFSGHVRHTSSATGHTTAQVALSHSCEAHTARGVAPKMSVPRQHLCCMTSTEAETDDCGN